MKNLKIGHYTNQEAGTGLTVFLFEGPAKGAYVLCGSAPATHELSVLDPENSVSEVHALVFSGGSAHGLFAASGVVQYLVEKNLGVDVPHGVMPIVPAAAIYDLAFKNPMTPNARDAYLACMAAQETSSSGQVGAGTGATVGKLIPYANKMSGGLGQACVRLESGVEVHAYVVVNAAGDIYNEVGDIIAGANHEGEFVNATESIVRGQQQRVFLSACTNTTLAAVFTNAAFTKSELKNIAKTATAGIAQVISPVFTCYDGDIVFAVSLGDKQASVLTVGAIAAYVVKAAIMDAVKHTEVLP